MSFLPSHVLVMRYLAELADSLVSDSATSGMASNLQSLECQPCTLVLIPSSSEVGKKNDTRVSIHNKGSLIELGMLGFQKRQWAGGGRGGG